MGLSVSAVDPDGLAAALNWRFFDDAATMISTPVECRPPISFSPLTWISNK